MPSPGKNWALRAECPGNAEQFSCGLSPGPDGGGHPGVEVDPCTGRLPSRRLRTDPYLLGNVERAYTYLVVAVEPDADKVAAGVTDAEVVVAEIEKAVVEVAGVAHAQQVFQAPRLALP